LILTLDELADSARFIAHARTIISTDEAVTNSHEIIRDVIGDLRTPRQGKGAGRPSTVVAAGVSDEPREESTQNILRQMEAFHRSHNANIKRLLRKVVKSFIFFLPPFLTPVQILDH